MENSPIAFALYCDRQLVLVLVLVFALLQGCFQSKPEARVYLVTVKLTQLVRFQISDFRFQNQRGRRWGSFNASSRLPLHSFPHAKETFRVRLQQIQVPSTHRQIDACFFELGFEVLGIGTEVEVEVEPNPRRWVSCPVVNLSSNASQSLDGI